MKRAVVVALAILMGTFLRCATTAAPEAPRHQFNRFLINPRNEQTEEAARSAARRFDSAWRDYQAGRLQEAERLLTELLSAEPDYVPGHLALAAIAMTRGNLDRAEQHVAKASKRLPDSAVVRVYEAELARSRGDLRRAYALYRQLLGEGNVSALTTKRYEDLRGELFNWLFSQATTASETDTAIGLLREALEVNAQSDAARRLLTGKLIEALRFEEALRELDPLLTAGHSEDEDIQEMLGEIDVGKGRYQEAIARYERLVRRSANLRFRRRLEAIKQQWTEANMPPQQRRALESVAVTREDLAVLIYWNIPAIRFARGLAEPPIAVDIEDVIGREELIRALAFRFFTIDPVTRRIDPYRIITAGNVLRILSRIAILRGVPGCASDAAKEPNEVLRATRILERCGVDVATLAGDIEAPVSGRIVQRALTQVAALLKSAEERQARQ